MSHTRIHRAVIETINTSTTSRDVRSGVTTSVVEEFTETRADRLVSTNIAQTMRARDITVTGANFKPNTRYYVFFDGIDVNAHMTPTSGTYGVADGTAKGTGLRSDALGRVSATFSIPNTNSLNFATGTKALKVTDSSTNAATTLSSGVAQYQASGELKVFQEDIISTRNGRVITQDLSESRMQTTVETEENILGYLDPLAQSFIVNTRGGVFATSVEFYFGAKDTALPATVQIRHMENGFPTQKVLPFAEITLYPASINVSADASSSTKFSFPSPVYLEAGREFCIVLSSNSNVYTAWVSEMGQADIATNDFIDQQPYAGSLFKSQNNSTWTPDQMRDLKMILNRASFTTGTAATVIFENDTLGTDTLLHSPIETVSGSKTFKVRQYSHGNYDQNKSNITIAGVVGDRPNSVFSFTDDTITGLSSLTADAQTLAQTSTSGSGTGCIATITTTTTATTSVVITNPGQGYAASDTIVFTKDSQAITLTIAAVKDTLGGIPIEYINTTHIAGTSASGATSSAKIMADMDEYLITIPVATWPVRVDGTATTPNYQSAIESTTGGGDSATATFNVYYDIIHTAVPAVELPNTAITTTFLGTSATQPVYLASPPAAYVKETSSTTITLNDNNHLSVPKIVASGTNESNEMGGAKSFELTCQLSSTANNVSPVLDVDTLGMIAIQNRINKVDSSTDVQAGTYVGATEARGDNNAAVYMTKQVQLENPANSIHIYFDGYRTPLVTPPTIDVYYKVLGPDSNLQFDDVGWTLGTIKKTVQADSTDFKEYTYEIESLDDFTTFSVKIVLQGVDSAHPPLIENFRAIALST